MNCILYNPDSSWNCTVAKERRENLSSPLRSGGYAKPGKHDGSAQIPKEQASEELNACPDSGFPRKNR